MKKKQEISFTESQLVDLYGLMYGIAYADGVLDKEELRKIFEMINIDGFSPEGVQEVQSYLVKNPDMDKLILHIKREIKEVRFTAYLNAIEIAISNDIITAQQENWLQVMKCELAIDNAQDETMRAFAYKAKEIAERGLDDKYAQDAIKSGVAGLGAVGVPLVAVYFSGSVIGLSAVGITSGLAALGLGLGMIPGIGMAIVVGATIFMAITKALDVGGKRDQKKNLAIKERRAQLILKNLQETITFLCDRMEQLEQQAMDTQTYQEEKSILQSMIKSLKEIQASKQQAIVDVSCTLS